MIFEIPKNYFLLNSQKVHFEKDTTEIVYDNKNLHITELEDTRPVFILFYLLVIKDNNPAPL
jgi:hypothetical protein